MSYPVSVITESVVTAPEVSSRQGPKTQRTPRRSQEALIEASLPLVHKEATSIHRRLPHWIDLESLIQSGVVGLLDAAARYDSSRGVPFQEYARYRIRGEIMEYLRSLDWASRQVRAWGRRLAETNNRLVSRLGREASSEEMATELGVSLERYYQVDHRVSLSIPLSLEHMPLVAEGELEPAALAPFSFPDPSAAVERKDLGEKLAAAIGQLSDRERLVVQLYYQEELTLKAIGERLGVTEGRTCQILSQVIARLREALRDDHNTNVTLH